MRNPEILRLRLTVALTLIAVFVANAIVPIAFQKTDAQEKKELAAVLRRVADVMERE